MRSVLIAMSGPVTARVIRGCRGLGLRPVVMTAVDDASPWPVDGAACVRIDGGANAFATVERVVAAAERAGVDAVYPGVDALAEDPALVEMLAKRGMGCVGPPAPALSVARDKGLAVARAARLGVPVLPHGVGVRGIQRLVAAHGFPIVVKPAGGCGGIGVHVVPDHAALSQLTREAGDAASAWYGERYIAAASIIGVTLAIDVTGATRLLGERESLLVADGRKLIDAAPVRNVPANLVDVMRTDAQLIADDMGLRNVCTVEFLVGPHGYSFMEVNARLIGAYEMVEAQTGLDLIALQLAIARGERLVGLPIRVDDGVHVAEARIYSRSDAAVSGPLVRVLAATRSRRSALARVERAIAECHPGVPHTGRAVLDRLADLLRLPTLPPSLAHRGTEAKAAV